MDILEVERVIGILNQEMCKTGELDYIYLDMSANGYCIVIEFLGHQIWTSDWDERESLALWSPNRRRAWPSHEHSDLRK